MRVRGGGTSCGNPKRMPVRSCILPLNYLYDPRPTTEKAAGTPRGARPRRAGGRV
jgi:hypothetical protein